MLHIHSSLPTIATTEKAWIDFGDFVGHEPSRVLDGLPSVTIFLYQQISLTTAHASRGALEDSLSERFPGLYAHRKRLQLKFNLRGQELDRYHLWKLPLLTERPA